MRVFIDLFGGGFNIGANVDAEFVIYNDICAPVVQLLETIKNSDVVFLLSEIDKYIEKYKLSKENKDGYLRFRENYNKKIRNPIKFYTLLCYAFNNQIRFNKNNEYNMPFGKNRSSFNSVLRNKFKGFCERLNKINCVFLNISFERFNFSKLGSNDFVYCDPPYLNSIASYNENGGWLETHERLLLSKLDELDNKGIKFALSNNFKYDNPILHKWKIKYKVHYLDKNYSNCNYQKKDKSKDMEVLITNY